MLIIQRSLAFGIDICIASWYLFIVTLFLCLLFYMCDFGSAEVSAHFYLIWYIGYFLITDVLKKPYRSKGKRLLGIYIKNRTDDSRFILKKILRVLLLFLPFIILIIMIPFYFCNIMIENRIHYLSLYTQAIILFLTLSYSFFLPIISILCTGGKSSYYDYICNTYVDNQKLSDKSIPKENNRVLYKYMLYTLIVSIILTGFVTSTLEPIKDNIYTTTQEFRKILFRRMDPVFYKAYHDKKFLNQIKATYVKIDFDFYEIPRDIVFNNVLIAPKKQKIYLIEVYFQPKAYNDGLQRERVFDIAEKILRDKNLDESAVAVKVGCPAKVGFLSVDKYYTYFVFLSKKKKLKYIEKLDEKPNISLGFELRANDIFM